MKVLKLIERITFAVALVAAIAALTILSMLDEHTPIAALILAYFVSGVGLSIVFLLVGSVLHYAPHKVVSYVGDALVVAFYSIAFGISLVAIIATNVGVSVIVAFAASILYLVSNLVRFIAYIVMKVNKLDGNENPDRDPAIQNVLKWKALKEEGIISAEEFEAKRVKLLHLEKKEPTK